MTFKFAHHGTGVPGVDHPSRQKNAVPPEFIAKARDFLARTFPAAKDAELLDTRGALRARALRADGPELCVCAVCHYCDTENGDFVIDFDPSQKAVLIATGDSGHGFKFGPVLGRLVADRLVRRAALALNAAAHVCGALRVLRAGGPTTRRGGAPVCLQPVDQDVHGRQQVQHHAAYVQSVKDELSGRRECTCGAALSCGLPQSTSPLTDRLRNMARARLAAPASEQITVAEYAR